MSRLAGIAHTEDTLFCPESGSGAGSLSCVGQGCSDCQSTGIYGGKRSGVVHWGPWLWEGFSCRWEMRPNYRIDKLQVIFGLTSLIFILDSNVTEKL